ncbi:MAG: two-component regulator propeller domain-containing protein, partial [Pseudomonadota bacterium]
DGRIWVGTISGGLSVFDPRTDRFTQYRHDPTKPASLGHDRVEGIAEDSAGQLWLGTDDGIDRLDPASGVFLHVAKGQGRALLHDREGRLWVGTRDGLLLRQRDGTLRAVPALAGQHITKLFEDRRARLWIGTADHGALVYDPASARVERLALAGKDNPGGLSHFWVYAFAEATPGEIWVATFGGGIDVIDPATLKVIDRLRHDGALASTIGNDRVGALLVDRSGLVWTGSWGGGLAWHDPHTRAFVKWRHSPANPDGISHPAIVRAREMADGTLWLGTNGNGIDIVDGDGHPREHLRPNPAHAGDLADGAITCLAQAPDGTIWVATLDGTLHRRRTGSGQFERFDKAQGLPGGPIRTMVFAPDGALWAGSLGGLVRIDPATDKTTVYRHDPLDSASLSGREVESLAFTPDGTLWVGTEHGINAFDTHSGKAVRIESVPGRAGSLPDNWVPDLMVARDGRLWLATQSGVAILAKWDGQHASFDNLETRLKLPAHPTESLVEDAQGQVWVGSHLRIDPASWRFRSFGRSEGNDFRTLFIASRARTRNGTLLFGSPEGLMLVHPDSLSTWDYTPPVAASSISIDGVDQPGASAIEARTLQPDQHNLRLEFAALDFSAPHKLAYRYRLIGFDRDWNEVSAAQRVAAYTRLPPGHYQLQVQASDRNGTWHEAQWQMALSVLPAFYQSWWFRLLMLVAGVLAVAGLFRLRLRHLRRRSEQLERTVAERTAALEAAYRRIEEASLTDPLTGLHNRRFLEQAIQADLDLAMRRNNETPPPVASDLVLFMLDLDHFKQVNDQYGHAAGDAVLVQTAQVLRACLRASDYVVRWGGEEFLLVARFVERHDGAALAEKIRAAIAAHAFTLDDGQVLRKTTSIGFAAFPLMPGLPITIGFDTLQRMADTALYAAKRGWRDAWVGVEPGAADAATTERAVLHFLSDAEAAVADGAMKIIVNAAKAGTVRWH